MLREHIEAALKTAIIAQTQKSRVSTLRLITAAIKDRDIAARAEDRCAGITEDEILALLVKMVKQRLDSASQFEAGGRPELAEQERAEIDIIREFLPRQMSDAEIADAVAAAIAETGATGLKDMGRTMAALKARYSGTMDFTRANAFVKKALGEAA